MSMELLGDVQLVTKQEVEAMIDVSVPTIAEEAAEEKTNEEKEAREAAVRLVQANLDSAIAQFSSDKQELETQIAHEAELRSTGDVGLRTEIEQEGEVRKQADDAIMAAFADFRVSENDTFVNAKCTKIVGLPIASMTVSNTDKSLHVGDTIATVSEKWLPKMSVDFVMYSEQLDSAGNDKTCMLICRLDSAGNVIVINMFDVAGATSATDTATFMYFTEK